MRQPTLLISSSAINLATAPPMPVPTSAIPKARPRFSWNQREMALVKVMGRVPALRADSRPQRKRYSVCEPLFSENSIMPMAKVSIEISATFLTP